MMRQTAAFQVSIDFDDEPWLRWRVLNAAAPYVVAIFANSAVECPAAVSEQLTARSAHCAHGLTEPHTIRRSALA